MLKNTANAASSTPGWGGALLRGLLGVMGLGVMNPALWTDLLNLVTFYRAPNLVLSLT